MIFPAIKYDDPDMKENLVTSDAFIIGILVVCAVLNGVGAALIWVANGSYISACAIPKTKGFFYGFFWVMYMSSQVVGSLIGAAIINSGRRQVFFFSTMAVIAALASVSFVFTREPLILETEQDSTPIVLQANQLSQV